MKRLVPILLTAALVAASPALAKEVGPNLDPPAPAGLNPGDPWNTTLFIVTPDHGLQTGTKPPTLTIQSPSSGVTTDIPATAGPEDGFYQLRVVFPTAGEWRYWVTDPASGQRYTFPAVTVGEPVAAPPAAEPTVDPDPAPAATDEDSFPWWVVGVAIAVALLLACVIAYLRGPRRAARAAQ